MNHCVNDILTTGAEPLFFLDYFATGHLEGDVFEAVISGFAQACCENGCALIGGETAEMPDFYQPGEYDLSGTIVGAVNQADLLSERTVNKGDLLVGLYSSGLHTNGYSLARRALLDEWTVDSYLEETGTTVGDALLTIHRSYLPVTRELIQKPWLHGGGHITGGGITGNLQRLLAPDQTLALDWDAWDWLPIFKVIQRAGGIAVEEMRKTFNLGIGWVYIIAPDKLPELEAHLNQHGEPFVVIGEVQ